MMKPVSVNANKFLNFLNTRHENIKFTIEKERYQKLPFPDLITTKTNNNRIRSTIYTKFIDIGSFTRHLSFTATKDKWGFAKILVDNLYKDNNKLIGFHNDIEKCIVTTVLLQKNLFPHEFIDKILID